MGKALADKEKDVFALPDRDRAKPAPDLIETLNKKEDENVEKIWLDEAEKRYEEYKKGKIKAIPAKEAFQEARNRLL